MTTRKPYKVVVKKLGKDEQGYKLHGLAIYRHGRKPARIEIDETVVGQDKLETLIHETVHLEAPYLEEEAVTDIGEAVAVQLWAHGYRLTEVK